MMHGFQQIVTQAERCDNFVVHGLPPLGDEMGVSPLIWRKKLMDSISGNLGYITYFSGNGYRRAGPSCQLRRKKSCEPLAFKTAMAAIVSFKYVNSRRSFVGCPI